MNNNSRSEQNSKDITLKDATLILRQFVKERNWQKYHTPRNLVMALMGEVGEIAEIFQWKGQVHNGIPQFSEKQRVHVGQQIADVFSYLIRLADVCQIDIQSAFKDKVAKNKKKYPSQQIRSNQNLFFQIKQQRRVKRQGQQSKLQKGQQQNNNLLHKSQ